MSDAARKEIEKSLVLGWRVNAWLDPEYWLKHGASPAAHIKSDLVLSPPGSLADHLAIIAQSGSGKSYFLGRLVEEILLKTKARCVIIDPNSDFKNVAQIVDDALWTNAGYDMQKRRGKLPHEATRQDFKLRWDQIPKRVYTAPENNVYPFENMEILWTNIEFNFIAANVEPLFKNRLYHCHEFVKAVDLLLYYTGDRVDAVVEAKELWQNYKQQQNPHEFRQLLEANYSIAQFQNQRERIENELVASTELVEPASTASNRRLRIPGKTRAEREIPLLQEQCMTALYYVTDDVANFYFGIADLYRPSGIVRMESRPWSQTPTRGRLTVLDLPMIDANARLLAVDTLLGAEWKSARDSWQRVMRDPAKPDTRVPVFIIVDEAHNMIPSEPRLVEERNALRERFRTIAAEGRKYGLFLILVSQRPDKLDQFILSECANRAVMRLGSQSVLEATKQLLGLEDMPPKMLSRVLDFELGRVLIAGPWSGSEPQLLYSAARRTVEGGRNLSEDYWATAPP
jgi:hypothetical protein